MNLRQLGEIRELDAGGIDSFRIDIIDGFVLDIKDDGIKRTVENDTDVILPHPTVHEPDIKEHHMRCIKESDGEAVLQSLKELSLECYASRKGFQYSAYGKDYADIKEIQQLDINSVYKEGIKVRYIMEIDDQSIRIICRELNVRPEDISNMTALKKGMTNRSFCFSVGRKKYIMRIPGEGTKELISRSHESSVYAVLKGLEICDRVIYIDPHTGYKISEYFENSRVCNSDKQDDVDRCMKKLKEFHKLNLTVRHIFDIRQQIEFYEHLFGGSDKSYYHDYNTVKSNVFELFDYVNSTEKSWTLCHIDSVPDNFLFTENGDIRLIDWEYAGMQDADVDIAMFAIYAFYDRKKIDQLIDAYYEEGCSHDRRLKIYCYISICGLLWSNWCEYKRLMGVEFGEYALRQYEYAIEYCRIFQEEVSGK